MESFLLGKTEKIVCFTGSISGTQTEIRCTLDLAELTSRDWQIPGFADLEMIEITIPLDKVSTLTGGHHIEWSHPTDGNTKWLYTGLATYDYAGPQRNATLLYANTYVKSNKGFTRQYFDVRRKASTSYGDAKASKTTQNSFYGRLEVLSYYRDRSVGFDGLIYQRPLLLIGVWNTSNAGIDVQKGDTIRVNGTLKPEYEVQSVNSYMFKTEMVLKEI